MPNRLISDSIRISSSVNAMGDLEFRLWVALIVSADDFGRYKADPKIIKGTCFPLQDKITPGKIRTALLSLAKQGSILLYLVDGETYLAFPKWEEHQRVRNKQSKYPAPEEGEMLSCGQLTAADSNSQTIDSNSRPNPIQSNTESNPIQSNTNSSSFTPPTLEEIADYCREQGFSVSPDRFFNYYESNGWKVGKSSMRNWRAALRNWEAKNRAEVKSSNPFLAFAQGDSL